MHMSLTHIKTKTRQCHLRRPCTLCCMYTAHLSGRKYFSWYAKPLSIPKGTLFHRHTEQGIFLISALFVQFLPCICSQVQSLAVCTHLCPQHTLLISRHTDRQALSLSLSLTHLSHPQEELQVLRGNPPSSQSLVNGIINFLMSMNITQRQPHGYGGMLPANIHAIRIFGFTHAQPLLSAVLTAAKLSLLHCSGRPHGSGWLAWVLEGSWTVVHSLLLLTTKDRGTLPAPIP